MRNRFYPIAGSSWQGAAVWAALALIGLVASTASAQQVYRIVGPDGRVSFSDQPPATSGAKAKTVSDLNSQAGASSGSGLPYALGQIAAKYPVTLYTSSNCSPCSSGRSMLSGRGIPFTEKTISTKDDVDALRRLTGDDSIPQLSIGKQQLKGYSPSEWAQYLDAAGYPKTSALPSSYQNAAASPLVAVKKAEAATAAASAPASYQPVAPAAPARDPSNVAGIKF